MRTNVLPYLGLLLLLSITACINPPNYPDTPVITYEQVNKTAIFQGTPNNPTDTLAIVFSFTDGDGDLSFEDSTDIFVADSRFPQDLSPYRIPLIPSDGTGNGIRGELTLRIINEFNICCLQGVAPNRIACPRPPNVNIDTDTFSYEIFIRDRAGNVSNKIRTETLTILCR